MALAPAVVADADVLFNATTHGPLLLAVTAYPCREAINLVTHNTEDFKLLKLEQLGVRV